MRESSTLSDVLIQQHWQEVYALLRAITRNHESAEDLAQEVFVIAARKELRPGPIFSAWLKVTARYVAINELRRKRPAATDPRALEIGILALPVPAAGTECETSFDDELKAMRLCLASLTESDRTVLDARYQSTASMAAIAETTGQSVGYLKQRLFRLRQRLARCVRARVSHAVEEGETTGV